MQKKRNMHNQTIYTDGYIKKYFGMDILMKKEFIKNIGDK